MAYFQLGKSNGSSYRESRTRESDMRFFGRSQGLDSFGDAQVLWCILARTTEASTDVKDWKDHSMEIRMPKFFNVKASDFLQYFLYVTLI